MAGGRKAARRFPKRDEAEARGRTGHALASLALASEGWLEGEPSLDGPFRPCKGVRERRGLDGVSMDPAGPCTMACQVEPSWIARMRWPR